jgi:hypothetical protein
MQVAMASMSILGQEGVDLKSVTEDFDRSTPLYISTTLVTGMAEMYSDMLGTQRQEGSLGEGASGVASGRGALRLSILLGEQTTGV